MKWAARLKEKIPDMPLGLEVSKPSKGYSVPVDTQETELSKPSKGSLDSLDTLELGAVCRKKSKQRPIPPSVFVGPPRPRTDPFPLIRDLFIGHITGKARDTGCCCGPEDRWCEEGRQLRERYTNTLRAIARQYP